MKSVYTAIPLALLAAVAQAELHLSSQHKESRNVGSADSLGSGDSLGGKRDLAVGDEFVGNGFNLPNPDDYDNDDGAFNPDPKSSLTNSAIGGPHNFNQQGGPYTDSGHNKIDDGINNDNIVITPVISQQAQQATESTDISPEPDHPHGPPPPMAHQPEQLPPQQHSDPKQSIPIEPETSADKPKASYQPPAAPAPTPVPEPAAPTHGPGPVYAPAPAAPTHIPAPVPAPAEPSAQTGPRVQGEYQEPPCPESQDGTHHMPMPEYGEPPSVPKEAPKPQPEIPSEPQVPGGEYNAYQPPHPTAPQAPGGEGTAYQPHPTASQAPGGEGAAYEPHPTASQTPGGEDNAYQPPHPTAPESYPQPHDDPEPCPKGEGDLPEPDHEKDHPHGAYPLPEEPEGDLDLYPAPGKPETGPEIYKPFPPGRQYGKPPSQTYVTPSSTFGAQPKAYQTPSSLHYASHKASAPPSSVPAKPTISSTLTGAPSTSQAPTQTAPSHSSVPSTYLGGAGFLAAPEGFTVAVLGALAFLL